LLNDVAFGGKPILTADATSDGRLMQRHSIMNFNIKSLVCVPIKLKEKILGTVYIDGAGSAESIVSFTNIDLEFLEAFAGIVAISIENARLLTELKDENVYLRNKVEEKYRFDNIIGNSETLLKVYKVMEGAIKSEGTVMIQGESGTGKELIAKAIHFNSSRKKERFVAVDCASLHETLLDSELFGHKKGSFTGAIQDKKGLFEEADNGTIFLDEIINTSLAFQAKLLRVLQEGEIRKVGDTESKFVNVRVIVAANKNIEDEVRQGRFREDLYYRLNVIPINVPPLRERREDIPLLVNHFIKKYVDKTSKTITSVSQELVDSFTSYDWPGNIRELENIINRMIIFAEEDKLTLKDIPADFKKNIVKSDPLDEIFKNNDEISNIRELEKEHILRTMEKTKGNKTEAAKLLGLKRTTLIERMKKYGLMGK
jgi:Nif-specific regulatory protein